jgi:putative transposase
VFCAVDFFSVELLTARGLIRYMVLFVMDIATRKVRIAGIHTNPNGDWMKQVARNLTDSEEGFLKGKRFLILDRDPLFTKAFKEMLKDGGVAPVPTALAAPMMNAHAERFVRAVKDECLNKLILTNEAQLRYVFGE